MEEVTKKVCEIERNLKVDSAKSKTLASQRVVEKKSGVQQEAKQQIEESTRKQLHADEEVKRSFQEVVKNSRK